MNKSFFFSLFFPQCGWTELQVTKCLLFHLSFIQFDKTSVGNGAVGSWQWWKLTYCSPAPVANWNVFLTFVVIYVCMTDIFLFLETYFELYHTVSKKQNLPASVENKGFWNKMTSDSPSQYSTKPLENLVTTLVSVKNFRLFLFLSRN